MTTHSSEHIARLITELRKLPHETEWVEFKVNNSDPEKIGTYLSALANSAALAGKAEAYVVWGIDDTTHDIVGTTFVPASTKKGNEALETWLLRQLTPKIRFRFYEETVDGHRVVLLEIDRASTQPVAFAGQEWVRVGSQRKKLKDTALEPQLWRIFDTTPFEQGVAVGDVSDEAVVRLLDYVSYFDGVDRPAPTTQSGTLEALAADKLIRRQDGGRWAITNLGAALFAKRLSDFPTLARKVVRVIHYDGNSRIESANEQVVDKGYASGFEELISIILAVMPVNEALVSAIRTSAPMYPPPAIRELVANALIHQDFSVTGAGPMVEIFQNRMEITNPGASLIEPARLLDNPPRSRNEALASLMRRMGVCEERGSGIDKVVFQTEFFQLPAPLFETPGDSTRAVLFAHRPLAEMDKEERIRACYLHASLKYVNHEFLTNASIRERFGVERNNSSTASRLIKEAVDSGAITPADEHAAKKLMKYVPFWAVGSG